MMTTTKVISLITAVSLLMLSSCEPDYPQSDTCHKGINIINNSNIPIFAIDVAERHRYLIFQDDTIYIELADNHDCLEWNISPITDDERAAWRHKEFTYYLCDTTDCSSANSENRPYDLDPSYNRYRVLKVVDLVDIGKDELYRNDFTIRYPR